ncbi:MAG TPA: twin-arginine translocase TatA/TatE family subunit [Armatimonadota bacterium]|jgi:sec-independent protein translocase protein TatA
MFGGLGTGEILLILLIILLLFGAKKIPEVMRGLGTGMKEFKRATRDATEEFEKLTSAEPEPAPAPKPAETVAPAAAAPAETTPADKPA